MAHWADRHEAGYQHLREGLAKATGTQTGRGEESGLPKAGDGAALGRPGRPGQLGLGVGR